MNKSALRKLYKEKRQAMGSEKVAELSKQICDQLLNSFDFSSMSVSLFLPIDRHHEILTWPLLEGKFASISLPVVMGEALSHIKYEKMDQLQVSDWGIPEPTYGEEVNISDLDIVFVPLLCIAKDGHRVGYGKGFYDGFLSQCNPSCKFVGLSYFEPVDLIEDIFENDVALHYCITPKTIHKF